MRILRSSSFIALLFVALVATPASAAWQLAPRYVSSEPEDGAMLDEAPDRVEVTFSEPLDPSSDLTVEDECGRTIDGGDVEIQASTMSVGIAIKPVGTYKVTYLAQGVGGVTGQETGSFTFMVHEGPSCDDKRNGDHDGHQPGGNGGSGNHQGGGGSNSGGQHSGSGGGGHGSMDQGTGTDSMDHSSSGDHRSMGHSESSAAHRNMGQHGDNKHGKAKRGDRNHGKHGKKGAHGLLDILDQNKNATGGPLAAGPDAIPAPDGRAVIAALALSLVMGVVGGWFLRVSGAR